MSGDTKIRVLVRSDGERLPVLLDRVTGQPLFDPTVYVVSQLRGRAANTIHQRLAALQVLFRFCAARGVNLARRVETGQLFAAYELDALVAMASAQAEVGPRRNRFRKRGLSRETSANRLRACRSYLSWLMNRRLHQLAHSGADYSAYQIARDRTLSDFAARLPSVRLNNAKPRGLTAQQRGALLEIVAPASQKNPWLGNSAQVRNFLIVRLLYDLGLRRGELLALRLEDVNVRECRISILRRPDDVRDPRRRQPVAKTEERILEISNELAGAISNYVVQIRSAVPAARRHGYVFVDVHRGAPLTVSALDKLFNNLRSLSELPDDLTSHVLRHDWNDRFSLLMDQKRVKPADELRLRKYLQGWRWDGSAQRYNRRHVERRANEALLGMQGYLAQGDQ